jgi:hypothetical protein
MAGHVTRSRPDLRDPLHFVADISAAPTGLRRSVLVRYSLLFRPSLALTLPVFITDRRT